MKYFPPEILITTEACKDKLSEHIINSFPNTPVAIINNINELKKIKGKDKNKWPLVLCHNKGKFLEKCPGTKGHLCCNYFILNLGLGCPFDCSYCFLQFYQQLPAHILFTNLPDLYTELRQTLPNKPVRLGTGEFMDSIALEDITGLHQEIIPHLLNNFPKLTIEIKTKSSHQQLIKDLSVFHQRLVWGWSLNPQPLIKSDEHFTGNLTERLAAAKLAISLGYHISIHLDPIIYVKHWDKLYINFLKYLQKELDFQKISWLSLGLLRFAPVMKSIVEERHPESDIIYGELFPGMDGKLRYPEPLRIIIYQTLLSELKKSHPALPVYLCMETANVWNKVFNRLPSQLPELNTLFS
jgi:spore photoproduct lyase